MTLAAALVAFGHFLGFFALASALSLQLGLLRENPDADVARRIARADRAMVVAALTVLAFGLLRVFYFDKGSAYYFANTFFQLKLALFVTGAVLSQFPSAEYRRWRGALAQGAAPRVDAATLGRLKRLIHWQLVVILGMLLCASLMARGFGN